MSMKDTYGITGSGIGGAPVPPGTQVPSLPAMEILASAAEQLQLTGAGVYTPWATQVGPDRWEVIERPDTNIATFALSESVLEAIKRLAFGQPVPFVAMLGDAILSPQQAEALFAGTAYQFHESQAIYSQADEQIVPSIRFIHWGELRDRYEGPKGSVENSAQANGLRLVFAQQVPIETTSHRTAPAMPFSDALAAQFTPVTEPLRPEPVAPPAVSVVPEPASVAAPFLIAAGATLAGFWGIRAIRGARKR